MLSYAEPSPAPFEDVYPRSSLFATCILSYAEPGPASFEHVYPRLPLFAMLSYAYLIQHRLNMFTRVRPC